MSTPLNPGLIVLGMHRSGTSAVTGVLLRLGVTLGPNLYRPHAGVNDKGYFEHSNITDVNDDALLTLGSEWDDVLPLQPNWWQEPQLQPLAQKQRRALRRDFRQTKLWGLKDPRLCRLLPWWQAILTEEQAIVRYLLMIREPFAVVRSLQKRDGFSQKKALILWIEHNLQALYWTRGQPRAIVVFDALLNEPEQTVTAIEPSLQLSFPTPIAQALPGICQFLSADLCHHRQQKIQDDAPLIALANQIYTTLIKSPDQLDDPERLADWMTEFDQLRWNQHEVLREHLRAVAKRRGESEVLLRRIFRSRAWFMGKPLRYMERLFGGEA